MHTQVAVVDVKVFRHKDLPAVPPFLIALQGDTLPLFDILPSEIMGGNDGQGGEIIIDNYATDSAARQLAQRGTMTGVGHAVQTLLH